MARVCDLTGKRRLVGNKVSHAKNRNKMRQLPNLHKKKIFVPSLGRSVSIKISSAALRTIDKIGIDAFARNQGIDLSKFLG